MERAVEVRPRALGIARLERQACAEELDPPIELQERRADDGPARLGEPLGSLGAVSENGVSLGEEERAGHRQEAMGLRSERPEEAELRLHAPPVFAAEGLEHEEEPREPLAGRHPQLPEDFPRRFHQWPRLLPREEPGQTIEEVVPGLEEDDRSAWNPLQAAPRLEPGLRLSEERGEEALPAVRHAEE